MDIMYDGKTALLASGECDNIEAILPAGRRCVLLVKASDSEVLGYCEYDDADMQDEMLDRNISQAIGSVGEIPANVIVERSATNTRSIAGRVV